MTFSSGAEASAYQAVRAHTALLALRLVKRSYKAQLSSTQKLRALNRAAAFAEKDRMQSVSDNIMLGQLCPIGTGSFTLLLDEGRLADAIDVSAGFFYGGSDADGRGGLTPGALLSTRPCANLQCLVVCTASPHSASVHVRLRHPVTSNMTSCRAHTLCDPGPCLAVANVLPRRYVAILQQRDVLARWTCDFLTVRRVAWLLTDEPWLLADQSWILSNEPRILADKPWLLSHQPRLFSDESRLLADEPWLLSYITKLQVRRPAAVGHAETGHMMAQHPGLTAGCCSAVQRVQPTRRPARATARRAQLTAQPAPHTVRRV